MGSITPFQFKFANQKFQRRIIKTFLFLMRVATIQFKILNQKLNQCWAIKTLLFLMRVAATQFKILKSKIEPMLGNQDTFVSDACSNESIQNSKIKN